MMLRELRKQNGLTQTQAAQLVGIPFRTYIRYEREFANKDSFKSQMIFNTLKEKTTINEEHGLLTIDQIKEKIVPILRKNGISFCYLFGSYAKGCPKPTSDVDLLVDTELSGLKFFNLVEEMRTALNKKIDLLRLGDLKTDNPIVLEILKEGIRLL